MKDYAKQLIKEKYDLRYDQQTGRSLLAQR